MDSECKTKIKRGFNPRHLSKGKNENQNTRINVNCPLTLVGNWNASGCMRKEEP
jgi:hypothetical protein